MGRSVSVPRMCQAIAYRDVYEIIMENNGDDMWQDFIGWIQDTAMERWPSLTPCDTWIGREDRAIIENAHCYIGISEYCGLGAIWLKYKDNNDHPELSYEWCKRISGNFVKTFGEFRRVGTFSNGEAVYERVS